MGTGSKYCKVDAPVVQNLMNCAKAEGKLDWLQDTIRNLPKLRKLVRAYHTRCPPPPKGKKRAAFKVIQYIEEVQKEESVIKDSVNEMMHIAKFCDHTEKKEKGSSDDEESQAYFTRLCDAPKPITDEEGPDPKKMKRVAVKIEVLAIERNSTTRLRSLQVKDAEVKKVDDEGMAKARHKQATSDSNNTGEHQDRVQVKHQSERDKLRIVFLLKSVQVMAASYDSDRHSLEDVLRWWDQRCS